MTQLGKPDYSLQRLQLREQLANASCAGFILMRHGDYQQQADSPSALQPWPLTDKGQAQAIQTAEVILNWRAGELTTPSTTQPITLATCIHSSTSLRAWQTASLFAQAIEESAGLKLAIQQTSALCERSIGGFANLSTQQIAEACAKDPRAPSLPSNWKAQPDFALPIEGAESLNQAGLRVARYIVNTLTDTPAEHTAIFVGHGASIRHAMVHLGLLNAHDLPTLSMHHCHPLRWQRKASHSEWILTDGAWKIRQPTEGLD